MTAAPNGWKQGCSTSTRRTGHRGLRPDHRPGPVRGRRRRQPAQGTVRSPRDRPQPHRSGQAGLEMIGRDGPVRDPDRLGHRRREPQRQHPARTDPASRRRPRTTPRRPDPAPGPRLRQQFHHRTLPQPRAHRHRLRQEEAQGRDQGQEAAHLRSAMAGRTHQLLVSNFGQLRRNTDRYPKQRLGQTALAIALILTVKLVKWAKRWTDHTPLSPRAKVIPPRKVLSLVGSASAAPSAVSRCSCRRTCCSAPGRQP